MSLGCEVSNDCANIRFHRQSLRGSVIDLVLNFEKDETEMETILEKTLDLFLGIHEALGTCIYKARLVAECEYHRLNVLQDVVEEASYHFASYSAERVTNPRDFYARHLEKIASRMDTFHQQGSNLSFQRIKHIHIALSLQSGCLPANFIDLS